MAMKDPRQGAAAVVFLVFYSLALAYIIYCLSTRRAKRYIFGVLLFAAIRLGANISALGWAINLYDNFDWLVANLILGAEGYFALVITILFCIVGYEKETFGSSVFYPDVPKGRNECLHRFTHISFWFEWSLIPANVLLVVGGSVISGGLSRATLEELSDPASIPRVRLGQTLRIIGQVLFFAAILAGYAALLFILRRAGQRGKPRQALWWMLATAPFLLLRGSYGIVSAADWKFSYYLPSNYGPNGLNQFELLAEYLMAVTPEAISLIFLVRTIWLITMPKALFVPYDKRNKEGDLALGDDGQGGRRGGGDADTVVGAHDDVERNDAVGKNERKISTA